MNCAEFQEFLPDVIDGGRTAEQEAHLRSCLLCAELIAELNLISSEAPQLAEFADPSPRVWNSLEIALRREGLIREPQRGLELVPPVKRSWTLAWLAPVATMAVLAFGVFVYQRAAHEHQPVAQVPTSVPAVTNLKAGRNLKNVSNMNDDRQLLEAVASRSPAMQAQYASNLQNVNAYIRDAEESAQADPNDVEAQQIVMDAYEQRAAVYEMALDRSLP
jgi:malate synthase